MFFLTNASGNLVGPSGHLCEKGDLRCATDSFDGSAVGTGDLFLRSKWNFYDTDWANFAVSGVLTLPTGNADDFLGFHDPTFTPWLIASENLWPPLAASQSRLCLPQRARTSVRPNGSTGADVRASDWLTLAGDFLGYHDDKRDGVNDDVIQSAVGFKINPFGKVVIGGNFQFPLNRDGLRADVIYTGQIEYTF